MSLGNWGAAKSFGFNVRVLEGRTRKRAVLLFAALFTLNLGWNARSHASILPHFLGNYAPDTLWALLVFIVVLLLWPRLSTLHACLIALGISYSIEVSQLYQAPWINSVRDTRLGGLLLGHGFLWSDLACYTVGILLGTFSDALLHALEIRRQQKA